jgi:hypothetical protein
MGGENHRGTNAVVKTPESLYTRMEEQDPENSKQRDPGMQF